MVKELKSIEIRSEILRCNNCEQPFGELHYFPKKLKKKHLEKTMYWSFLFCSKECAEHYYLHEGFGMTIYHKE